MEQAPTVPEKKQLKVESPLGAFCDLQPVHMRDLRKLDASFSTGGNEPMILVRKQAILINAGAL